jgi:hypothetical protein
MLNIPQAIADGSVVDNNDGTFTVTQTVTFHEYDIATRQDVENGLAHMKGVCFNHRKQKREVTAVISNLRPEFKNGDKVMTTNGEAIIRQIDLSTGNCTLEPTDSNISFGLPHSGSRLGAGNIYQLPQAPFSVGVAK